MNKSPAYQFYPGDYIQDTRVLSLAARGAWQDLLCFMWQSDEKGKLSYSIEGYSRLFGASIEDTKCVIDELVSLKICDTVTERNGNVTLINRRIQREERDRKNHSLRKDKYRSRQSGHEGDGISDAIVTSPSSLTTRCGKTRID